MIDISRSAATSFKDLYVNKLTNTNNKILLRAHHIKQVVDVVNLKTEVTEEWPSLTYRSSFYSRRLMPSTVVELIDLIFCPSLILPTSTKTKRDTPRGGNDITYKADILESHVYDYKIKKIQLPVLYNCLPSGKYTIKNFPN